MSVFLDNQPLLRKLYPDNSIIHTYNTKVFTDYNTAVELLMYKVLCPGEITFAYYNDENSTYGINAIFAVGPLVHGGGNIIFRNALELLRIFDELNSTIIDINVSINKIKDNLFSSLCDVSTKLDQTVADAVDSIKGQGNIYQQLIDGLYQKVYDIKISLDDKAPIKDLEELSSLHETDVYNLNDKISKDFNTLLSLINELESKILKYIQDAIRESVSSSDDKSDLFVSEAKTELLKAFKTIQDDYYSLYNEVKTSLNNLIIKHTDDVNILHTNVNNLTNKVDYLEKYIETSHMNHAIDYEELKNKVDNLYHRFLHHIIEHPDSFNNDLVN